QVLLAAPSPPSLSPASLLCLAVITAKLSLVPSLASHKRRQARGASSPMSLGGGRQCQHARGCPVEEYLGPGLEVRGFQPRERHASLSLQRRAGNPRPDRRDFSHLVAVLILYGRARGHRNRAPSLQAHQAPFDLAPHILHTDHLLPQVAPLGPAAGTAVQSSLVRVVFRPEVGAEAGYAVLDAIGEPSVVVEQLGAW